MNVFVILGSQKFQFNRLLTEIDKLAENKEYFIFAQIGYSDYQPKNFSFVRFLEHSKFKKNILDADLVITHAGSGSILSSLKLGKKIIAFSRDPKFNEHVDDHQRELLDYFCNQKYILGSYYPSDLFSLINELPDFEFKQYEPNTKQFIDKIYEILERL